MDNNNPILAFSLYLADNSLILGQRNAEWCGHGPILEQDIAITNISLDLIGQARSFYQFAAELKGGETTEDSLAYLRTEREYLNCLLVEQPNGDWAQTVLRQFFFSAYQVFLFEKMLSLDESRLAAIAEKSLMETRYHLRWSSEWVIRLGDGTAESRGRMLVAIENLWRYTGELFNPAPYELEIGLDTGSVKKEWQELVDQIFAEAGLSIPDKTFMQSGGKIGAHTEHLGYILTELQYMQRTYPDAKW